MNTLKVHSGGKIHEVQVVEGSNLRKVLLENGLSPYTCFTQKLNCGGNGICATCGVWIIGEHDPSPTHWHDKLAKRFGYSRLSCQIQVNADLEIELDDKKIIWGKPRK